MIPHAPQPSAAPTVHVVAVTPPPVTGMTVVTERMVANFAASGAVAHCPVTNASARSGLGWTISRQGQLAHAMSRAIRAARAGDVCYLVPDAGAGLWGNLLVQAPMARAAFRRILVHHHVYSYVRRRDRRFGALLRLLGRRVEHIVLCERMAADLEALYTDHCPKHVLGNTPFVTPPAAARERSQLTTLGFIGNITRDKGVDLFMATVREVARRNNQVRALIAGPVRDTALQAEIAAFVAEAPDRRHALGPVYGAAKQAFYDGIDVLLFPSRYRNEAQPVTIYEALAAGVPVLATPLGCVPAQLRDTGWLVDENAFPRTAAERLQSWLDEPARYRQAGAVAARRWRAQRAEDDAALSALLTQIYGG